MKRLIFATILLSLPTLVGCSVKIQTHTGSGVTSPNHLHSILHSYGYVALAENPTKVVVTRNGSIKTMTKQNVMNTLVHEMNQAGENVQEGSMRCNVMTADSFRIAFYYQHLGTRVFENVGGACQPMHDVQNGFSFLAGSVLADRQLM